MPSFSAEFETLCGRQARQLGRDLRSEELQRLEGELFESWLQAGRVDELIRTVLARHGNDGGLVDIVTLAHHLRSTRDEARIHAFLGALLTRRVKAFYRWWPKAAQGHLGSMQAAARAAAEAMDAFIEYVHSLHALGLDAQCEQLREGMRRFQDRDPLKQVLAASLPAAGDATGD